MKKFLAMLLAVALVLALLTGCGNSAPANEPAPANNTNTETPANAPADNGTTEPAKQSLEGWKIGAIDMSGFGYPFYIATQNMLVDVCKNMRDRFPLADIDKWAYIDDIIKLSNVEKGWKEGVRGSYKTMTE